MSRYIFLFDLDSTITCQEILPTVAKEMGIYEKMCSLTESTMRGEVPFSQSFLQRVELLKGIPVQEVSRRIAEIRLNEKVAAFIRQHRERCYIVTGNLDVWIEKLVTALGMEKNTFCSRAAVKDGYIRNVISVVDKNAVVSQMVLPFVAVGDGNNDAEMVDAAGVGIGYGGVREIAPPVLACADYAFYDEGRLVEFLEKLL